MIFLVKKEDLLVVKSCINDGDFDSFSMGRNTNQVLHISEYIATLGFNIMHVSATMNIGHNFIKYDKKILSQNWITR